jgi:hypothetical protein
MDRNQNLATDLNFGTVDQSTRPELTRLTDYEAWLLDEVPRYTGWVENPKLRIAMLKRMYANGPFFDLVKADPDLKDAAGKMASTDDHVIGTVLEQDARRLRGFCSSWANTELDSVVEILATHDINRVLAATQVEGLKKEYEELLTKDLIEAKTSGLQLMSATEAKQEAKKKLKTFLGGLQAFKFALHGKRTQSGIELLDQVVSACETEIHQYLLKLLDEKDPNRIKYLEGRLKDLQERGQMARGLKGELEAAQKAKTETKVVSTQTLGKVVEKQQDIDRRFRDLNRDLASKTEEVHLSIEEIASQIGTKKAELEKLIDEVPKAHADVSKLRDDLDQLEQERQKAYDLQQQRVKRAKTALEYEKLMQEGHKGPNEISKLKDNLIRIEEQAGKAFTQLKQQSGQASEALQKRLEEAEKKRGEIEQKHVGTAVVLANLNAKYNAMYDHAAELLENHDEVAKLRLAVKGELDWLKSLPKAARALNIYASSMGVSYKLFLAIAKLPSGDAGGLGDLPLAGPLFKALIPGKAYDTGSLDVSVKLGLSWGKEWEAFGGKIGAKIMLALVWEGSMNVQDDRRFRTSSTFSFVASAGVEIPKVFKVGIEAELYSTTTTMVFKDAHQWAAWMAQKWANVRAWVMATAVYDGNDKYGEPTPVEVQRMRELATISLLHDKQTRDLLEAVLYYVEEPIVRVEKSDLFGGVTVELEAFESFGVSGEYNRTAEPKYFKRLCEKPRYLPEEMVKEGKEQTKACSLTVLGAKATLTYSNTMVHSNPDFEGEALTLDIELTLPQKEVPSSEPEALTGISKWAEEHVVSQLAVFQPQAMKTIGNSISYAFTTKLGEISGALSFTHFEMSFCKMDALIKNKKESRWKLYYLRPIISFDASISKSIPLDFFVPGLNFEFEGSLSLQRTYFEQLGTDTLGYLRTVYHGFMNISDGKEVGTKNPRPESALGPSLWNAWALAHKGQLWTMMGNIASDDSWIRAEVDELKCGQALIGYVKGESAIAKKQRVNDTVFKSVALPRLKEFLEAARTKEYLHKAKEDWERYEVPPERWGFSLRPSILFNAFNRQQQAIQYNVDRAKKKLGERRDLSTQIASDVKWVPDEDAPSCQIESCKAKFTVFTRRHHCRNCGRVVCGTCSKHELALPFRGLDKPQRVCNPCHARLSELLEKNGPTALARGGHVMVGSKGH